MAKNKMTDLRDHLFATLESLRDEEKPMDLDRARTISRVAQTLIDSAKVEVELVKALDRSGPATRGFFDLPEEKEINLARSIGPGRVSGIERGTGT